MNSEIVKEFQDLINTWSVFFGNQEDYWYDPCGKSGLKINEFLSKEQQDRLVDINTRFFHLLHKIRIELKKERTNEF